MNNFPLIVAAKRSAIGRLGGSLKSHRATDLAVAVGEGTLQDGMAARCEGVVAGQVLQAGCGMNPARQVALALGVPMETPAWTTNMVCGSGLKAVAEIADAISAGRISCGLAVGMESMSQAPYYSTSARWGSRYGDTALRDALVADGLTDPGSGLPMGETAERIADQYGVSRSDQDAFALQSQRRVSAAREHFREEIVPIQTKSGLFAEDEHPRPDTTLEKLTSLKPAFRKEGTVTAGNSSGLNDAAAVLFLASPEAAKAHGWCPLARIVGWQARGCEPTTMGLGPIFAISALCDHLQWNLPEVDAVEINEAFAAQALACIRELKLDPDQTNPRGGAIALGHPIGCSGARILVTLLHHLRQTGGKRGIASLCIGGGMGIAMAVESLKT